MFVIALILFLGPFNSLHSQPVGTLQHKLKTSAYSFSDIENYKFYLENNSIDFSEELKILNDIKSNFEKDYLKSVIYKKQNDFENEFQLLFNHLNSPPANLSFYDELIFAANASGNFNKLEKIFSEKNNSGNHYLIYLHALYNYENGNYKEAYKKLEQVLNYINLPDIYYHISYSQRSLGDYDKAFQTLQKGKDLLKKDDSQISKFTIAQGSLLYLSGKYKDAMTYYQRGLEQADSAGNNIEKIKALVNIGILLDDDGDVYKAREYFNKAVKLADKINSAGSSAFANSEMGVSYTLTNELIDAQKHYKISFDLYKKLNNKIRLAFLSNNLGNFKMSFADYNSALNYYNKGMRYAGENKRAQIQNLTGIAGVYNNLANYTKALEYYNRAGELASEIKDISLQVNIKLGLGILYFNLGRIEKALEVFKEAESLIGSKNYPFLKTDILHKLGITYLELDDYNVAENYLKNSLNISKKTGDILNELTSSTDLAFLFFTQKKFDNALSLIEKIIPVTKEYWLNNLLGMQKLILGKIYKHKENFNKAINVFNEADEIGKENNNTDIRIEAGFQTAEIYRHLNKNVEAEKYYLNSINLIDIVSKNLSGNSGIQISYFSNYKDVYDSLTEFYLSQKRNKEAFLVTESSRSRNTIQNLNNIKLSSIAENKDELQKIYEIEWMLSSGIYDETEIDSLNKELEKTKKLLVSLNPSTAKYFSAEKKFSIEDIQINLNDNENLVSIYISRKFAQYFLITKNDFTSGKINIERNELLKLIYNISPYYNPEFDAREIYYNHDLFSFNAETSHNLYKDFFEEIVSHIPKNESIVFNLPAELVTLPLEFLVTEYEDTGSPYNYDNKKFMIHDYGISYTPSFKIYLTQKKQIARNSNNILLLGDPSLQNTSNLFSLRRGLLDNNDVYTRLSTLYPLEFSREEVQEIEAIAGNTTLLLSEEATETNFKLNTAGKNIIHLSTHSFQYNNQPLVVFSNINDSQNDGILEAGEIINLNLTSDLVVLSSCRSGLGEIDKAEGILGMQKAFYEAGAKSLVVSLWDVSDKYTSKFMTGFYKYLREGKSKSEALRFAKIEFIKKYSSNPYYWSAFVLYGNEEAVKIEQPSANFYFVMLILAGGTILLILYIYKKKS